KLLYKPDRKLIDQYLRENLVRKLHIGCGGNILPGWLNADVTPLTPLVLLLDARQPFAFRNEIFDYVYTEHMIEHLAYSDGLLILTECHRVLKRGGKIRISTPNFRFLVDLYLDDKSSRQEEYIRWVCKQFIPSAPQASALFVINNFVRDWGHQ